uniref:Ionotropic receptor n=1 Tax=Calliphora stygia TaxID=145453 RepID=A0A068FBN5_CALSG|nr:ionotropic receptor [Calliphora stygia]
MLSTTVYWSQVISAIAQLYLKDTTICLIWNSELEVDLKTVNYLDYYAVININLNNLQSCFEKDIDDFNALEKKLTEKGLSYNELTEKLTMAIEKTHCESFITFQHDILNFIESFINASQYSDWRSKRNRFVFGYIEDNFEENFQQLTFFEEQDSILLVSMDSTSSSDIFILKTNKYYGPKAEQQNSLVFLDKFYAENATFLYNHSLFPDKTANLRGREVIIAGFDYRPYFVINYGEKDNNSYDLAFGGSTLGAVQIDGTEARVVSTFCEIYNCTVWIDSSEANDWGEVYPNLTGDGSLGMVVKDMAEISIGAMYSWDVDYLQLDMSMYLVRSGITCLVPAPRRLTSWLLPLQPFQFTLWLAVMGYLLVEIISLCFAHKFESNLSTKRVSWHYSFKYAYATTLKLFVSQSGNSYVSSLTVRVLLFTCFMNDIILTSIYGGGLASILTIPSYEKAADTVDGMLYHKLQWAANSEAWVSAIRSTDDDRMNGILYNFFIYNDDELEVLATTRSDMGFTVERLPFGHFAIGDYLSSQTIEHLKIMKEDLYFQYTVAFVKRCWPLLDRFDHLIYWWHSAGLDKYWEWRIVAVNLNVQKQKQVEATMYSTMEDNGPVKLGMSNFAGILLIWVLGISVAMMAFVYEITEQYFKCKKSNV